MQIATVVKDRPWLDYSSLSLFMRCPRAYYWRIVRGVSAIGGKAALINGEAYHAAIAEYHRCILKGMSFSDAALAAIRVLPPIMAKIKEEDPKRNLSVATETIAYYLSYWKDEHYKTINVEIGFAIDMVHFVFVGKIDRRATSGIFIGESPKVIFESKTTSIVGTKWQLRVNPNLQCTTYVAADYFLTGEMPGGFVLDVIPLHADAKKRQAPFRLIGTRSLQDIDDWADCVMRWWKMIEMCHNEGVFPMNTEMCHPLTSYSCEFATLCSLHPHPYKDGDIELTGDYTIERWAPYDELLKLETA